VVAAAGLAVLSACSPRRTERAGSPEPATPEAGAPRAALAGQPLDDAPSALPCAPGTECLRVDRDGTANPDGTSIAQCSGAFPDYIVPATLFPAGYAGPWFELAQDFPDELPAEDAPWASIDFEAGVEQAEEYLFALRDYAYEGNLAVDFRVQENAVRPWFTVPYMNYGPGRRELVRGLTRERPLQAPELGIKPDVTVNNYAIGFYNAAGGFTTGQVWADPHVPDLAKSEFPSGAMVFKILFSDAVPEDFEDPSSYLLEGSPEWEIATGGGQLTTVRLLQMDVAVRDDRAPESGWVFGTLAFDREAPDQDPWLRMRPVGLQWGNAPGYTLTDQQNGVLLPENIISDLAPAYAAGHLGWAGRLNGPVDNPISACMSCHGTAQYPVDAALGPFSSACNTDEKRLRWFRNLPAGTPFGVVDGSTCEPGAADPPPAGLDFSLQIQVSVQSILQFGDTNPCIEAPPVPPAAPPGTPTRATDAPRIGRDGFFEEG
jgi:hypothetical protein